MVDDHSKKKKEEALSALRILRKGPSASSPSTVRGD
jgi:hypothetical protein